MAGCQRQKRTTKDLERIKRWIRVDETRLNIQAVAQSTVNHEQKRDHGKKSVLRAMDRDIGDKMKETSALNKQEENRQIVAGRMNEVPSLSPVAVQDGSCVFVLILFNYLAMDVPSIQTLEFITT